MIARPLLKARSVDQTASGFPTLVAEIDLSLSDAGTATGRAVIPLTANQSGTGFMPRAIDIWPYGLGSDNDAFSFRLIAWRRVLPVASTEPRRLWIPAIILEAACTLGNFTGLAGFPVLNTEFFCDVITAVHEPLKTDDTTLTMGYTKFFSPNNDTPGHVIAKLDACEAIEFQWKQTTNTPAMNALYSFVDDC